MRSYNAAGYNMDFLHFFSPLINVTATRLEDHILSVPYQKMEWRGHESGADESFLTQPMMQCTKSFKL